MSITLYKIGDNANISVKNYTCDTIADRDSIEGTEVVFAYVIGEGKHYIRNSNSVWSETILKEGEFN
jgi:hypothetical protein